MEWSDLVPNEDLDLRVKVVTRVTALQIRLDAKLMERLRWKDKRVKVQISLAPGRKRVRLSSAPAGWILIDKKTKGMEISVRQLVTTSKYTRCCEAAIDGEALVITLPEDFELKNPRMVVLPRPLDG